MKRLLVLVLVLLVTGIARSDASVTHVQDPTHSTPHISSM